MHFLDTIDPSQPLRVLFRNHQQLLGDRLAMTSFVRDVHATYPHWQITVDVAGPGVWRNNPHVAGVLLPGDPEPPKIDFAWNVGPGKATQGSRSNGVHFIRSYSYGWTRLTGLPVTDGPWRPDLHLSLTELAWRPVAGEYWVFNPDTNNMGSKRWPPDRWRALVRSRPDLRFVQVGLPKDCTEDYGDEPNVTSLVGQTDERQLFALVAGASGCISLLSSLMHVAAAFGRPCVVLAGGREPASFEAYPGHYYLSRVGMLDCCRGEACWKNSITACRDQVATTAGPVARCMTLIDPADVARGLDLFSPRREQDLIDRVDPVDSEVSQVNEVNEVNQVPTPSAPRLLRIVTNGKCLGGAERSVVAIARMFRAQGWQVEVATRQPMCGPLRAALSGVAVETAVLTKPADVLLWYASDQVFDADKAEFEPLQVAAAQARRLVMALTYKLGKVPHLDWCHGWDEYLFLSSTMANAFGSWATGPEPRLTVLAPPVDLAPFLAVEPDYAGGVRVVRHSSQGDDKWPVDTEVLLDACPDTQFHFMPGPSWLAPGPNYTVHPAGTVPVPEFLGRGNLFLYLLPDGYTDQGPRVVVEAMAAGLPVLCQRRDGCADRVTEETGWFVESWQQAAEILQHVTPEDLRAKGQAARARARRFFDPWRWYEAIAGEPRTT